MITRKVKYLTIPAQFIAQLCKKAIKDKIPQDSEILRVNYNTLTNNYEFVIYSEEFPEIKEGTEIPKLVDPTINFDML